MAPVLIELKAVRIAPMVAAAASTAHSPEKTMGSETATAPVRLSTISPERRGIRSSQGPMPVETRNAGTACIPKTAADPSACPPERS